MTSLGRLIFFDQPGTGASDPVTPGALPTLEQWADSIAAVLDDLGSSEAVLLATAGALPTAALFAATHPSRTTALVVLEGHADPPQRTHGFDSEEWIAAAGAMWGTAGIQHAINPDMPWNEEIRATWAREERLAASPGIFALMQPLVVKLGPVMN
jgi:pimeloyl-ACP methyl ester carboxylesterase